MLGRRKFLALMGMAPAAAPLVAKAALEKEAATYAGIKGLGGLAAPPIPESPVSGSSDKASRVLRTILSDKKMRDEFESLTYESYRHISALDPDIACLRSYSLAAKIAFQRQRNVARSINNDLHGWPWQRLNDFLNRWSLK